MQPPEKSCHFLVLGATGPSGIRTVELALLRQHSLTLYARSPQKLPENIVSNPLVTVIKGELDDADKLASCFLGNKIDCVISALGPKVGQPKGNPITRGYETLLAKMHEFAVSRLVLLSTISVLAPQDVFSYIREGLVNGIKLIGYTAWTDVVATSELVRSEAGKGLEITLARVSTLGDGQGGTLHVGFIGEKNQTWVLSRIDLAQFFVKEAEKPEWINQAPVLCSTYSTAFCSA